MFLGSTIQQWCDAFRQGGIEALLEDARANNLGLPDSLIQDAQEALEKDHKEVRWRTVLQIHADLNLELGITIKLGLLYNRLGKAGARLRVPCPVLDPPIGSSSTSDVPLNTSTVL